MDRQPPSTIAHAWRDALTRRGRAWWSYALHLTNNEPDAEDLVQTMLIAMLERRIAPDDVAPSYPFRVMRNAHVSLGRRARTRRVHTPRLVRHEHEPAADDRLAPALEALTDDQREVITLKHAAGLTLEQIATATGKPLGTVAGLHRRAIATLRERLAPREETAR
ncbi:MAG: sigma-70 family RNA polymerase sigma factor [Planctomycetota bacterium]